MPRRKRGANLAPRSASAQSMRRARQEETEEEASQRRSQNAAQTSRAKANETDDQTTHRNALNAARTAACPACETNDEASQRRAANAALTKELLDGQQNWHEHSTGLPTKAARKHHND